MNGLLAALAGSLVAGGLLCLILGLRPAPEKAQQPKARPSRIGWWAAIPARRRWAGLAALTIGVVAGLLTGWVVLIVLLPSAVLGLPVLLASPTETGRIARLDGIAEWTRNLSGVLTAGQGLEQALMASLRSTPEAVRPQVGGLVARLRARWPTEAGVCCTDR